MKFLHFKILRCFSLAIALLVCFSFSEEFKCPEQFRYYRDFRDCSKYYVCVFGDALHEKCTGGLHFSSELQTCDCPRNVNCLADEIPIEEKSEIEEEIFSSSRRTSATAANENSQPQIKPQTLEKEPVLNYQPFDNSKEESKENPTTSADVLIEFQKPRTQSSDQVQHSPNTETTVPPHLQNPRTTYSDKSVDNLGNVSEDPLYASDQDSKLPLNNCDPQEPRFDEAALLIDSEGGIHITDGGHGLDEFAGLAHLPGLGDYGVSEKPIFSANTGNQENDEDYKQRNSDQTLSTKPRSLESYPNSNSQSKDLDVVIDYSNGNSKELKFDFQDNRKHYGTLPPVIFDDNADNKDYGGFDIITPIRKVQNPGPVAGNNQENSNDSDLLLLNPIPTQDLPRLERKLSKELENLQRNAELNPANIELANHQKFNFNVDRNLKRQNATVHEIQLDDQPSNIGRETPFLPQNVRYLENEETHDVGVIDSTGLEPSEKRKVSDSSATRTNNGKSEDPDVQFSRNEPENPEFVDLNIGYSRLGHEPIRNGKTKNSKLPEQPRTIDNTRSSNDRFNSVSSCLSPSAKDSFSKSQEVSIQNNQRTFNYQSPQSNGYDESKLTFLDEPVDANFGTYTGNQRQPKKVDTVSDVIESQSITDIQKQSVIPQRHPNLPNRRPPNQKVDSSHKNDGSFPENYDSESVYDGFHKRKHEYTNDYYTQEEPATEATTRPTVVRTRPTRPRKLTTTTTIATPIKVRSRTPLTQVPKPSIVPKPKPSIVPKPKPSIVPKPKPSIVPKPKPSIVPKPKPSIVPKPKPSIVPKPKPSIVPKPKPSIVPKPKPSIVPKPKPSIVPKPKPSIVPKPKPSIVPKPKPSIVPKPKPSIVPKPKPSIVPKPKPSIVPKPKPSIVPKPKPSIVPKPKPSIVPKPKPSIVPKPKPSIVPKPKPSIVPKPKPSIVPKPKPSIVPKPKPSIVPKPKPSIVPKPKPSIVPKPKPSIVPKPKPSIVPKPKPSIVPKPKPSIVPKPSESPPTRPPNQYPTPDPYTVAQMCDPRKCRLPDCRCGGTDIPGGLSVNETPQLILLTFDDAVNDLNKDLYDELFNTGRVNPNGCPILGTFYVSHEWADYGQVQSLYSQGHEIASHSITHSEGEKFSKNQWMSEIHGQREILNLYGRVKMEDIRGMRAPFLQTGGNKMFEMLYDANFTYDSSMPVYDNNPPFWPYTLDYALSHECMIFPCPTKSYPGLWEVGMVMWVDLTGGRCSMGDACSSPRDEEAVAKMLMENFNRHYKSNRSPFGLFYHSAWFITQHRRRGFMKFLDEILQKDDVWFVTNWQLIQWMRNPKPISQLKNFEPFNCRRERPPPCPSPAVCNVWYQGGVRYMKTCQPCPAKYPWVESTGYDNRG